MDNKSTEAMMQGSTRRLKLVLVWPPSSKGSELDPRPALSRPPSHVDA